jgi:ribosomal protein S18 acetylase RimI-like enzyme
VDADSDPERPEVFSQYVYPRYRGCGFGAVLEHVWWAYLEHRGCATAYMRMELDSNNDRFERRRASGYYREISAEDLGRRQQVFFAVDVKMALAASTRARGPLNIDALPIQFLR